MSKPKPDTSVSDEAWIKFLEFADLQGVDTQYKDDWYPWFEFFEAGYIARMEE
jgi:hypothetical protein